MNHNLRRAIAHKAQSDYDKWVMCLALSRIIGNYDRNGARTREDAARLNIGVRQLYARAQAGQTYRDFQKVAVIRKIKWQLSPSHFEAAGTLMRKYEIPPREIIEDLRMAAENDTSVTDFRRHVDGNHNPAEPKLTPKEAKALILEYCELRRKIQANGVTPAEWIARKCEILKQLEEWAWG